MKNQITTLAQAEQHLRNNNLVRTTNTMMEVVEGKQLLTVCGFKYTDRTWTQAINRQIKKHDLVDGIDYFKLKHNDFKSGAKRLSYMFNFKSASLIYWASQNKLPRQTQREDTALSTIEQLLGIKLIRQYKVGSYRIDGYCKETNTAYEIDEPYHFIKGQLKPECKDRQLFIESELQCKVVRIKV